MESEYTLLKGGKLIDGTGADALPNSALLIKGSVIESVGKAEDVVCPGETDVIDVTGQTVMPGIIDAHIHMFGKKALTPFDILNSEPFEEVLRGAIDAWRLIDAGMTTVRDCGSVQAIHLRNSINEGTIVGPRILASGRILTQTAGHGDIHQAPLQWAASGWSTLGRICDGEAECRKGAREQLRYGADFLKLCTTGGVMSEKDSPDMIQFSLGEVKAIAEEARNWGCRVASHSHAAGGIRNALLGGVNTIEHAFYMDDDLIELALKNKAYIIPTLMVVAVIASKGAEFGVLPSSVEKAKVHHEAHVESIKKAYKAGITIGLGTDCMGGNLMPHGINTKELELYVELLGMSAMEAIVCATKNNADALDILDEVGTLEPGKLADLLLINGDPLEDIRILQDKSKLAKIFKGGAEVPRLEKVGMR